MRTTKMGKREGQADGTEEASRRGGTMGAEPTQAVSDTCPPADTRALMMIGAEHAELSGLRRAAAAGAAAAEGKARTDGTTTSTSADEATPTPRTCSS